MLMTFTSLLLTLLLILIAAEVFTNALEHLGHRLGISEGVTGSLFAAVGTAMPETMVPLLAIIGGSDRAINQEIGVGAILGAPLMLSTLSLFLMGLSVWHTRGPRGAIMAERNGLMRDLHFFLGAYVLSAVAMFLPHQGDMAWGRSLICLVLILLYLLYVLITLRASGTLVEQGHGTDAETPLFLSRIGLRVGMTSITLQLALGLILLVGGAKGFIASVEAVSQHAGISPLLLSLMVIPIATELPEKINSILWIRKGKDTLALGNITGAMVFQGTLLPAMGIALTPWAPRPDVFMPLLFTLSATIWLRLVAQRGLRVGHLALNGAAYLLYLAVCL